MAANAAPTNLSLNFTLPGPPFARQFRLTGPNQQLSTELMSGYRCGKFVA